MHVQTHILSGWCVANALPLTPRQRLCAMIAATAPDLDGLTILGGWDAFREYHHMLCHNLVFCVLSAAILATISGRRLASFALYFTLAHLHLALDYYGSGPLWRIYYWWPFSKQGAWMWADAWEFFSWQNIGTFFALFAWTIYIAARHGRTPLERIMPSLDRQLVDLLLRRKPSAGPT